MSNVQTGQYTVAGKHVYITPSGMVIADSRESVTDRFVPSSITVKVELPTEIVDVSIQDLVEVFQRWHEEDKP